MRYRRKAEVLETRQRVRERRIILSIVKAKYRARIEDPDPAGVSVAKQPLVFYDESHIDEGQQRNTFQNGKLVVSIDSQPQGFYDDRPAISVATQPNIFHDDKQNTAINDNQPHVFYDDRHLAGVAKQPTVFNNDENGVNVDTYTRSQSHACNDVIQPVDVARQPDLIFSDNQNGDTKRWPQLFYANTCTQSADPSFLNSKVIEMPFDKKLGIEV